MTPRRVPRHLMDAYEIRTGFKGLGLFLEQEGKITLIDGVKTCIATRQE